MQRLVGNMQTPSRFKGRQPRGPAWCPRDTVGAHVTRPPPRVYSPSSGTKRVPRRDAFLLGVGFTRPWNQAQASEPGEDSRGPGTRGLALQPGGLTGTLPGGLSPQPPVLQRLLPVPVFWRENEEERAPHPHQLAPLVPSCPPRHLNASPSSHVWVQAWAEPMQGGDPRLDAAGLPGGGRGALVGVAAASGPKEPTWHSLGDGSAIRPDRKSVV